MSYSAYLAYVNALAALTVPIQPSAGYLAVVPVKLFNVNNNKVGATVDMTVDTGAQSSILSGEYAKPLGINLTSSKTVAQSASFNLSWKTYAHGIRLQIGDLKPIVATFFVADKKIPFNLLGWKGLLERVRLEVFGGKTKPQLKVEELAALGMANSQAYYRSRV